MHSRRIEVGVNQRENQRKLLLFRYPSLNEKIEALRNLNYSQLGMIDKSVADQASQLSTAYPFLKDFDPRLIPEHDGLGLLSPVQLGPQHSEDSVLVDAHAGIFAVLDGVGGSADTSSDIMTATRIVKETLYETILENNDSFEDASEEVMRYAVAKARLLLKRRQVLGATTLSAAWIRPTYDRMTRIQFASIGDSWATYQSPLDAAIHVQHAGRIEVVPRQFHPSRGELENYIGSSRYDPSHPHDDMFRRIQLPSETALRIILATDGISSKNFPAYFQTREEQTELSQQFMEGTAQEKADSLVEKSTVVDDRTAVVIDISPEL